MHTVSEQLQANGEQAVSTLVLFYFFISCYSGQASVGAGEEKTTPG